MSLPSRNDSITGEGILGDDKLSVNVIGQSRNAIIEVRKTREALLRKS